MMLHKARSNQNSQQNGIKNRNNKKFLVEKANDEGDFIGHLKARWKQFVRQSYMLWLKEERDNYIVAKVIGRPL